MLTPRSMDHSWLKHMELAVLNPHKTLCLLSQELT